MDLVYERCCGLDVHKRSVAACLIVPRPDGVPAKEVRTFGTMTQDLLALGDWLGAAGVTHVAMESTGVYWKPIWNLLEDRFTLILANARHIKAVPGRKTDVRDCEWVADLLRHGLLHASFVPDRAGRERRELTAYRRALVDERTAEINRLQKTLEGANLKLSSVASDVVGVSGRAMLQALVDGTVDPSALAQLAHGRLRDKLPELERALVGRVGPHERFLLGQHLAQLAHLDRAIEQVSAQITERMRPFEDDIARLDTIPGVAVRTAQEIVAQIGTDMSRFPSARHIASWAGVCPGNHESAGKRYSGRTRPGNAALQRALVEAAHAAGRTRNTYLSAQFHRLVPRCGVKKTALAVGHSILTIAYCILRDGTTYTDLGANYFDLRDRRALERRLIKRLEALGNHVTISPDRPDGVAA